MRVALIGTRGIPNTHGGFEAFAQQISSKLIAKGVEVVVYQPCNGSPLLNPFNGIPRIAIKSPFFLPKNIQRVFYNYFSLIAVRKLNYDAVICCGHSPAIFFPFLPESFRQKIIVNMDGLEWRRGKWGVFAKLFLKLSEKLAARYISKLVADSIAMQTYLISTYKVISTYIPYGADVSHREPDTSILKNFGLEPNNYAITIARIEPENQTEIAISAFLAFNKKLVIVGSTNTRYAKTLVKKYGANKNIIFLGPIYETHILFSLRYYSNIYYHGHSVGGTNPSLLDAMASNCIIAAHDNDFNRETLLNGGYFFTNQGSFNSMVQNIWNIDAITRDALSKKNFARITEFFSWDDVANMYLELARSSCNQKI